MRYGVSDIFRALSNPALVRGEVRKYSIRANAWYLDRAGPGEGVDVVDEDWDTLVILDGCRYDTFEDVNTIEGRLESRTSRGTSSWEFMRDNFQGRELHDTVYVTANPFVEKLDDGTFHATVNLLDEWDDDLQTVHPSSVVERTREVAEQFPRKQYLVHFMQPHYPFIGEFGRSIDHRGYMQEDGMKMDEPNVWKVLQYGYDDYEATESDVRRAYRENLSLVLDHVEELLGDLGGKAVISADHGNLLGERVGPIPVKGYGHHYPVRAAGLVEVPWHVVEDGTRREVVAEAPAERAGSEQGDVDEKLRALGYKT